MAGLDVSDFALSANHRPRSDFKAPVQDSLVYRLTAKIPHRTQVHFLSWPEFVVRSVVHGFFPFSNRFA
jgi:hypothetical protein